MPEILYRDDINKFSVYRLADIPDGVPRSGWASLAYWRSGELPRVHGANRGWLTRARTRAELMQRGDALCAVADEHAGPLLEKPTFRVGARVIPSAHGLQLYPGLRAGVIHQVMPDGFLVVYENGAQRDAQWSPRMWELAAAEEPVKLTFSRYSNNVSIPASDFHAHRTSHLGAQHGEDPRKFTHKPGPSCHLAWSAHLRHLVQQSEQRDREQAPSVVPPPALDDDATIPNATDEEMARLPRAEDLK